jgi:hypothetical protein
MPAKDGRSGNRFALHPSTIIQTNAFFTLKDMECAAWLQRN